MNFLDIQSPKDLFVYAEKIFSDFYLNPTDTQLFTLIFILNHLRDGIVTGKNWKQIEKIPISNRTPEELFFEQIYNLSEFKDIINPLCNGLKHYKIELKTVAISGARVGLTKCGDSLSQKYFLINDIDSRDIFYNVLEEYRKWFT